MKIQLAVLNSGFRHLISFGIGAKTSQNQLKSMTTIYHSNAQPQTLVT